MLKESVDWSIYDTVLREKAEARFSAGEIAALIPNATRSAVLGRARRTGVVIRRIDIKSAPPRPKPKPKPNPPAPVVKAPAVVVEVAPPQRPEPSAPKVSPFKIPEGAKAITIGQLRIVGMCRWPYDLETPDGDTFYCGKAEVERSFCAMHYQMAYVPAKPKETKRWR